LSNRTAKSMLVVAVALGCAGCGGASQSGSQGSGLTAIGAGLKGPAGLRASVYATGLPTVATLTFDARGRLWATAAGLTGHAGDGVYLIAAPDARPRRVISGLNDPIGLLWYRGSLLVASVGRVDAFSGLRDGHFAHRRTVLVGPVARAENNNLVTTPDGRLLMGISATCDHCRPASAYDGAIVSLRPDGSGLRLYAGRIRAPYGLALIPATGGLLVTMNQRDDLGAATPGDWLAIVRAGQSWGFPGCYGQGGAVCAGVPKPLAVVDPHAAIGSVVVATGQLGPGVGTSALVTEWQSAKLLRVALTGSGSGVGASATELVLGLRNPLGLVLAPDGSLLVGDWGTGTIYRIARAG
jgi:glucose/arabinose dehydrogenase